MEMSGRHASAVEFHWATSRSSYPRRVPIAQIEYGGRGGGFEHRGGLTPQDMPPGCPPQWYQRVILRCTQRVIRTTACLVWSTVTRIHGWGSCHDQYAHA